jgi:hypothetical protein
MNTKFVPILTLAVGLIAGSLFVAQAQSETKPAPPDTRIDKIVEQNEKILKTQDDILKALADLKEGVLQIRRRSS